MTNSLKIFNLSLRGLSIVSKFFLILYITKYFSLSDLGVYGIFFTTITILVLVLGLDFYMFNTREILSVDYDKRLSLILNQSILHIITYLLILPLVLGVFYFNILPWQYLVWFYGILIAEHLSQELYRLFITLSKPLFANFLLFIRTSSWIYILLFIWIYDESKQFHNLELIWKMWFLGSVASILLGIYQLKKTIHIPNSSNSINFKWIQKGLTISAIFFLSTIMLKTIEFSDRYMIQYWLNNEDLGIYTFYANFTNVAQTIVFTLVVMIHSPKILEFANQNNFTAYRKLKTIFNKQIIFISLISFFVVIVAIYGALYLINKTTLYNNLMTFYILNFSILMQNYVLIYYYDLYSQKKDKRILTSTIIGAILNIVLNIILIPQYGIIGAAIATLLSIISILITQYIFTKELKYA